MKRQTYSQLITIVINYLALYFLEVNTHPDFTDKSSFKKSLDATGVSLKTFFEHITSLIIK